MRPDGCATPPLAPLQWSRWSPVSPPWPGCYQRSLGSARTYPVPRIPSSIQFKLVGRSSHSWPSISQRTRPPGCVIPDSRFRSLHSPHGGLRHGRPPLRRHLCHLCSPATNSHVARDRSGGCPYPSSSLHLHLNPPPPPSPPPYHPCVLPTLLTAACAVAAVASGAASTEAPPRRPHRPRPPPPPPPPQTHGSSPLVSAYGFPAAYPPPSPPVPDAGVMRAVSKRLGEAAVRTLGSELTHACSWYFERLLLMNHESTPLRRHHAKYTCTPVLAPGGWAARRRTAGADRRESGMQTPPCADEPPRSAVSCHHPPAPSQ